jgi:hypothetical protein
MQSRENFHPSSSVSHYDHVGEQEKPSHCLENRAEAMSSKFIPKDGETANRGFNEG